ncbi:MAG: DUF4838 domain-containing protein, partial [Bacteroidota bacterium]
MTDITYYKIFINSEGLSDDLNPALEDLRTSLSYFSNVELVEKNSENVLAHFIQSNDPMFKNELGSAISIKENRIEFKGATKLALQNAIYNFLHLLDFNWYFSGELWATQPKSNALSLPDTTIVDNPKFLNNRFSYTMGDGRVKKVTQDLKTWLRRNKMVSSRIAMPGHSYHMIANPKRYFPSNPEWFALIKGKRNPKGQLCTSNEMLRMHAKRWIRQRLEKNPKVNIISVSPNDGDRWCECDQCSALGTKTDQALLFA